jgi:hypothetical protein
MITCNPNTYNYILNAVNLYIKNGSVYFLKLITTIGGRYRTEKKVFSNSVHQLLDNRRRNPFKISKGNIFCQYNYLLRSMKSIDKIICLTATFLPKRNFVTNLITITSDGLASKKHVLKYTELGEVANH